jgi:predicted aspartyl protease
MAGVAMAVSLLAFPTGPVGGGTGVTPIALPMFGTCRADISSSGTDLVVPVRVVRPASGGALLAAGVCVDGHGPFRFLVDTGASTTAIDSTVAARLHLRPLVTGRSPGFGCDSTASLAKVGPLTFDGLSLEPQVVVVGTLRSPLTPALDGLLGSDVLSRFGAVRIDFSSGRLTLAGPEGPPTNSSARGGHPRLSRALVQGTTTRAPAVMTGTSRPVSDNAADVVSNVQFRVAVGTGGRQMDEFLVDTGAGSTFVSSSLAARARLEKVGRNSLSYAGLACPVSLAHYRMRSWDLGAVDASGHFAPFPLPPQTVLGHVLFPGLMGLLGSGTLRLYSPVVLDYRDGDLLLGPISRN